MMSLSGRGERSVQTKMMLCIIILFQTVILTTARLTRSASAPDFPSTNVKRSEPNLDIALSTIAKASLKQDWGVSWDGRRAGCDTSSWPTRYSINATPHCPEIIQWLHLIYFRIKSEWKFRTWHCITPIYIDGLLKYSHWERISLMYLNKFSVSLNLPKSQLTRWKKNCE